MLRTLAIVSIAIGAVITPGGSHFDRVAKRPSAYDAEATNRIGTSQDDYHTEEDPTFSLLVGGDCKGGASSSACSGGINPLSGVSKLAPGAGVTINSKNFSPMLVYEGVNCTASSCTATGGFGETLSKVEAGTDFAVAQVTPLLDNSAGVDFNAGDYFEGATSANDITTEDIWLEVMIKRIVSAGANTGVFSKATASAGITIVNQDSGGNNFKVTVADGVDTVTTIGPNVGNVGDDYVYCSYGLDRSEASTNGSLVTCDGVSGTGVNANAVDSMANANKVIMGAATGGTLPFTGHVLYVAVYKGADWFAGGAQNVTDWEAIHRLRWAKLNGMAANTAGGQAYPVTATRAAHAYLDNADPGTARRHMFLMAHHWPLVVSRVFAGPRFAGYVAEPAETNRALRSEDISTSWTAVLASVSTNTHIAPNGQTTADNIIGSGVSGAHGITQVITPSSTREEFSAFFSPGDNNFAKLQVTTVANAFAYFNVSACTVGTIGGAATAWTENWGTPSFFGGSVAWCRCGISYTSTGIAETYQILSAAADNNDVYTGDANADLRVWGIMAGDWDGGYVGSYVTTAAGTVTRAAEVYQYAGGLNFGSGSQVPSTMKAHLYGDSFNLAIDTTPLEIDAGGSTTLRVRYLGEASTDNIRGEVQDTTLQHSVGTGSDIYLSTEHPYAFRWVTNDSSICIEATVCSFDTSGTIPVGLDRLYIGSNGASLEQPMLMISDVKIYPFPRGE